MKYDDVTYAVLRGDTTLTVPQVAVFGVMAAANTLGLIGGLTWLAIAHPDLWWLTITLLLVGSIGGPFIGGNLAFRAGVRNATKRRDAGTEWQTWNGRREAARRNLTVTA